MQPFPSSSDFKFLLKWLQLLTHIFHAVLGVYNCNSYSYIVLMLQKVVNGMLLMNVSLQNVAGNFHVH